MGGNARRGLAWLAAIVVLTACTPTVALRTSEPSGQSRATIAAQPTGSSPVRPSDPVQVKAANGRLASVTVTGPKGPVAGAISADGTTWTVEPGVLGYGASYRIEATAMDARGVPVTTVSQFTTIEPEEFFTAEVSPTSGSVVGVGMPVTVTFSRGIKDKAAIERAMVVRTPESVEGAWSWVSNKVVEFRPRAYWPGNIEVTVDLNLTGIEGSPGVYGKKDSSTTFAFGPAMVTKVDARTFEATVYRDGQPIRTMPITTGKPGFETRSGIKVILSKERSRIMDAASGGTSRGDPEYYRVLAEYAMRVTPSGEFLHAAPWSVGSQGRANVSHGCVGMSISNAEWLYERSMVGDVVEVTGTPREQNLGNGITIWNESWDDWLSRSASGPVWTTGADGASTGVAGSDNAIATAEPESATAPGSATASAPALVPLPDPFQSPLVSSTPRPAT
jgi:lipoprotein-anchoring transpeptidase ErfK/SrfK